MQEQDVRKRMEKPQKVGDLVSIERKEIGKCKWCGRPIYKYKIGERNWFGANKDSCGCKEEKERQRLLEEQRKLLIQERLDRLFQQSRLGRRFRDRTFENFRIDEKNKRALQAVWRYAERFHENLEIGKGLIIMGKIGTGKTHLAAAVLHKVISQMRTGILMAVPELLDKIRATYREDAPIGSETLLEELKKVNLLILDDIGKEKPTIWARERLYVIINARYENMLPTVYTTNCREEELRQQIGEAITSRIYETCEPVLLISSDYRKNKT